MSDELTDLTLRAEACIGKKEYADAGRYYERAAEEGGENKVDFLIKAAQAFEKICDAAAKRCYYQASQYVAGNEKAQYLLACWRVCIAEIAGYEWECCFEWSGDDSHDGDHEIYQSLIERTSKEAENYLREALDIEGVNIKKIVKEARKECKRRKGKDGWGAYRCMITISNVKRTWIDC
ncbi:MAG: hypothetical protein JXA42_03830 [Anaerolineales bacterium]|nr:hypothetical protein [Anaerolineales bacterium]